MALAPLFMACGGSTPGPASESPPDEQKPPDGPKPIDDHLPPGCGLPEPAFCETFDEAKPGGRGADIDEKTWSFARWGNVTNRWFGRATSNSASIYYDEQGNKHTTTDSSNTDVPSMCGEQFSNVDALQDVRVCGGQLNEVFNDNGTLVENSMRIRQPFDFTGRTGTVVFDVDAKRNDGWDGHGWWLEIWISEDPTPIPYHGAPTIESYTARGAVGFQVLPHGDCFGDVTGNNIGRVVELDDYEVLSDRQISGNCFKVRDTKLNRFRLEISKNKAEFFVSDFDGTELKHIVTYDLDLTFEVGYLHFQHVHYNAGKVPNSQGKHATSTQAYRWDNIGFDGPRYPTPRGYDAQESARDAEATTCGNCSEYYKVGVVHGFDIKEGQRFEIADVDLTDAVRATLNFNALGWGGRGLQYQLNGNGWQDYSLSSKLMGDLLRTVSLNVPLTQLVPGTNVLEFQHENDGIEAIGNIDITVDASK
ncbi:MAG TPA: hypothetical protein VGK73_01280 [Polyangiaceae bacterium]